MVQRATVFDGHAAQRQVEDHLILFAVWLVDARGVAPSTAKAYISTVRAWHGRRFGDMLPSYAAVRLKAVFKGMRALKGHPERNRRGRAIKTQHLATGLAQAFGSSPEGLCATAALSLAFCGLLRVSEYAAVSAAGFDKRKQPRVCDVRFGADEYGEYAAVLVNPSKKGQQSKGKSTEVVVRDGELLQPVAALKAMLRSRKVTTADEPLFMWRGRPLTRHTVTQLVRLTMEAAGQPPKSYNSHGLRIGGATAALAAGVPPESIRIMGRWDSDVYQIYCRMSRQVAMRVGSVIASTPFDDLVDAFNDEDLM